MKNATLEWIGDYFVLNRTVKLGYVQQSQHPKEKDVWHPSHGFSVASEGREGAKRAVERHFGIEGGKPNTTEVG